MATDYLSFLPSRACARARCGAPVSLAGDGGEGNLCAALSSMRAIYLGTPSPGELLALSRDEFVL